MILLPSLMGCCEFSVIHHAIFIYRSFRRQGIGPASVYAGDSAFKWHGYIWQQAAPALVFFAHSPSLVSLVTGSGRNQCRNPR